MSAAAKPKAERSSVFERLASSSTSVRSTGSAGRSPTLASRSPTASAAAKTPTRASTPTQPPASPRAKAATATTPSKAAAPAAAKTTPAPKAATTTSAKDDNPPRQQAPSQPQPTLAESKSTSATQNPSNTPSTPPSQDGAAAPNRPSQDPAAAPVAQSTPPPTNAPTPAEAERIEELTRVRDERASALAAVDLELSAYALRYKAINAQERAAQFQKRTEDTNAENKRMKKEIDLLRNADRVMVQLRDTAETLKKHYRIRSAHIRQKIATIELIAKRCVEQRQERVKMLDILETNAELVARLALDELSAEQVVEHIDPLRTMASLLRYDGLDEEFIECTIRDIAEVQNAEVAATAALQSELKRLEFGIHTAAGDSTATMEDITAQWTDTKTRMMCEYQRLLRLNEEFEHHVKRGTHIKSTAQLPQALSTDETKVRELVLALAEAEESAARAKANATAEQQRLAKIPASHRAMVAAKDAECVTAARREADLANANDEWRERFTELQLQYTEHAIQDSALALRFRHMQRSPSPAARDGSSVGRSPSRDQATPGTPRSSHRSLVERLHNSNTRSRQAFVDSTQLETQDRALRSAQMRWRPVAAK